MNLIQEGDLVYLIADRKRKWILKMQAKNKFHCDRGYINHDDLIGQKYGITIRIPPYNNPLQILKPIPADIILHNKRESQIIYPEDIGLILSYGAIRHGINIFEAGTGSGTVTSIMALMNNDTGLTETHEIRPVAHTQAKKNFAKFGIEKRIVAYLDNFFEDPICGESGKGEVGKPILSLQMKDFIMLDLANTWEAAERLIPFLGKNGRFCLFSPTIEQVKKNIAVLQHHKFNTIISFELLARTYQVKPNATRPHGRMVGHTGYMTFGRKEEDEHFPDILYSGFYTPEAVGNLIMYGGLSSQEKILYIDYDAKNGAKKTPLREILENLFNIPVILASLENIMEDNFGKEGLSHYSRIICEYPLSKVQFQNLSAVLADSGIFCGIATTFESMKSYFDLAFTESFSEVMAREVIKREIILNSAGEMYAVPSTPGFIAVFGRKIVPPPELPVEILKDEKVDPIFGIGKDFADSLPVGEEKIDYANLREDQ